MAGPGTQANAGAQGANGPLSNYTLPGVLHFLQIEWRKYERERNEWEIERADLKVMSDCHNDSRKLHITILQCQARISFLEGERRGIENLKTDLLRRVKMLEFALRQER